MDANESVLWGKFLKLDACIRRGRQPQINLSFYLKAAEKNKSKLQNKQKRNLKIKIEIRNIEGKISKLLTTKFGCLRKSIVLIK